MSSRRTRVVYLLSGATTVDWEIEDHLGAGNPGSAVLVIQEQSVATVAKRVQVGPLDHNVHVF